MNSKWSLPFPPQDAWVPMSSFNPSLSSNPYMNGSRTHYYSPGNLLCFCCGMPGHKFNEARCTGQQLSYSEQNYLKAQIQAEIGQLSRSQAIPTLRGQEVKVQSVIIHHRDLSPDSQDNWTGPPLDLEQTASWSSKLMSIDQDRKLSLITINSFTGEASNSNKRTQLDIDELINPGLSAEPANWRKLGVKGTGIAKKRNPLALINGMISETPVDLKKLMMETKVYIPFL